MSNLHTRSAYEIGDEAGRNGGRRDPAEYLIMPDSPDGDDFIEAYDKAWNEVYDEARCDAKRRVAA